MFLQHNCIISSFLRSDLGRLCFSDPLTGCGFINCFGVRNVSRTCLCQTEAFDCRLTQLHSPFWGIVAAPAQLGPPAVRPLRDSAKRRELQPVLTGSTDEIQTFTILATKPQELFVITASYNLSPGRITEQVTKTVSQ